MSEPNWNSHHYDVRRMAGQPAFCERLSYALKLSAHGGYFAQVLHVRAHDGAKTRPRLLLSRLMPSTKIVLNEAAESRVRRANLEPVYSQAALIGRRLVAILKDLVVIESTSRSFAIWYGAFFPLLRITAPFALVASPALRS